MKWLFLVLAVLLAPLIVSSPTWAIEAPANWGVDIVSYRGVGKITDFTVYHHRGSVPSKVCEQLVRQPEWRWSGGLRRCVQEVLNPKGPNAEILALRGGPTGIRTTDPFHYLFAGPVHTFEQVVKEGIFNKLNLARSRVEQLESQLAKISESELQKNLERLSRQLAGVAAQRDLAMEKNEELQKNSERLAKQLAAEQGESSRLQSENQRLQGELQNARSEVARLQAQVASLEQENDALRAENAELKGSVFKSPWVWGAIALAFLVGAILAAVGFFVRRRKRTEEKSATESSDAQPDSAHPRTRGAGAHGPAKSRTKRTKQTTVREETTEEVPPPAKNGMGAAEPVPMHA